MNNTENNSFVFDKQYRSRQIIKQNSWCNVVKVNVTFVNLPDVEKKFPCYCFHRMIRYVILML